MADTGRQPQWPRTVCLNDLTVAAEYEEPLRSNGLDSLDALFSYSDGELLTKPGLGQWKERIRMQLRTADGTRTLYMKRFSHPPGREVRSVRRSGSGASSAAGTEWSWLNHLASDGIACAKPVALGEDLVGTRERRSAIVTEAVRGDSLERWVERWGAGDRSTIRALIEPTARLISRLHGCGYIHRDLYLSHIFFDPDSETDESLRLIDLQRVIRPGCCYGRWVIKDLASLDFSVPCGLFSTADRLRWLKHYLGVPKLDARARRMVYLIVGKAQRIARHERRRQVRLR